MRCKKTMILLYLFFVLLLLSSLGMSQQPAWADPTVVTFADPNLEAALREILNKHDVDITSDDLSNYTSYLNLSDRQIQNIDGLEYAVNITYLSLGMNQITDLTPLKGLTNLKGLELYNNQIINLSPLANLTGLTSLSLQSNDIDDLSPLANLIKLQSLGVDWNGISDLSPLSGLYDLRSFHSNNNIVSDISPLANMTYLSTISLEDNQVSDISPLSNLGYIHQLNLKNNQVSDISPLVFNQAIGEGDTILLENNYLDLNPGSEDMDDLAVIQARAPYALWYNPQKLMQVDFTDSNLEAAIRFAINKNEGEITNLDLLALTTLDAPDSQIQFLNGLENAINLSVLNLSQNQVTNIEPLINLDKLNELYLDNNLISDISPLNNLPELHYVNLSSNQITVLSPLLVNNQSILDSEDYVDLRNNYIDLSEGSQALQVIQTLLANGVLLDYEPQDQLSTVNFPDNKLEALVRNTLGKTTGDITNADMNRLTYLFALPYTGINNLSGLEYAKNLSLLILEKNLISDISPLSGLTNLRTLRLNNNSISDLSPLAGLRVLQEITLGNNSITDISPLAGLDSLLVLDLNGNTIGDFSPLAGLVNIQILNLNNAFAKTLSPLTNLVNIQRLLLNNNGITDITPLGNLLKLDVLELNDNKIRDISPLANTPQLRYLYINNNLIQDISVLTQLTTLNELKAANNRIVDLSPLSELTFLFRLDVRGNFVSDLSPLVTNMQSGGLGQYAEIYLLDNLLDLPEGTKNFSDIQQLTESGASVYYEPQRLTVVQFLDPQLEAAVRSALGKFEGEITNADMTSLLMLNASNMDIQFLDGLEYAVKLEELYLDQNQVNNLIPLAGLLGISHLNLSDNLISDLSPLTNLLSLQEVNLESNLIESIVPLVTNSQSGGLGTGAVVMLENNYLDTEFQDLTDLQFLIVQGAMVTYELQYTLASVQGQVRLQGKPVAYDLSRVAVLLVENSTSAVRDGAMNNDGWFVVNGVDSGAYTLLLRLNGYLKAEIPLSISLGESKILTSEIILLAGDVNQDDHIDILDLVSISYSYGKRLGQEGWEQAEFVDYTNDGLIDLFDMVIMAKNLFK